MSALSDRLSEAKGERGIDSIVMQAEARGHMIDRSTVARYCAGRGAKRPPDLVLQALAAGLGLDVRELRKLAGMPAGELGPWKPPDESSRLSEDQRQALNRLIKTIVAEGGEEHERGSAPIDVPTKRERLYEVVPEAARGAKKKR